MESYIVHLITIRQNIIKSIQYKRHMADGTFVSWIAMDRDEIIGTSGMLFVEKPPYLGCPYGRIGLLSSMFTNPDYMRKGIAKELLSRVINEAMGFGCGTVQITALDMGVKLYILVLSMMTTLGIISYSGKLKFYLCK